MNGNSLSKYQTTTTNPRKVKLMQETTTRVSNLCILLLLSQKPGLNGCLKFLLLLFL